MNPLENQAFCNTEIEAIGFVGSDDEILSENIYIIDSLMQSQTK